MEIKDGNTLQIPSYAIENIASILVNTHCNALVSIAGIIEDAYAHNHSLSIEERMIAQNIVRRIDAEVQRIGNEDVREIITIQNRGQ